MTSVDLAFNHIAEQLGADVTYWRLWDQSEWLRPPGGSRVIDATHVQDWGSGLTYELARGRMDEVVDADAVLFWGDFLHMAVYLRQTADVLSRRMDAMSFEEALDCAAQYYLLRGCDVGSFNRVITYGSTLAFNTASDYSSLYGMDLARFVGNVRRAWFRDPYSASTAQTFRSDELSCKAPDAAFLLPSQPREEAPSRLGVFIGRSNLQPEAIAAFGRDLARRLDLEPLWIPWGIAPGFWPMDQRRRFRAAWPGLEHNSSRPTRAQIAQTLWSTARGERAAPYQPAIGDLFDTLASCSVIVTDTYHLAVNAWRLRTPTVCVFDGDHREWNVNAGVPGNLRDKRYDLYSQLDALPLLVDGQRLRPVRDRTARSVAEVLEDGTVGETAIGRAQATSSAARSTLVSELRATLLA